MNSMRVPLAVIAVGLAVTAFSCSKAPTGGDNNSIAKVEWAYPMKVGNRWNYNLVVSYTDSAGAIVSADTQRVACSVSRTELLKGVSVFAVKDSADTITESYAELRTEGLYIRGVVPGAFVSLCKSSIRGAIDPSAFIYDRPRFLFPVQVTAGMTWVLDTIIETYDSIIPNDTMVITREFLGEETVATAMGNLACRKFSTMYSSGEIVDYVSAMGLTKRSMEIDSFPYSIIDVSSFPNNRVILTTYREELLLTSADLK